MPFWTNIYFINANSPIIEQIIFFHDHSIEIILSIIIFLFLKIIFLYKNNIIFLNFIENQLIELVWTIIPMILLVFIAAPSLRLLYLIEEFFSPNLRIKIIGHQWYWSYEYTDFNINFDSFIKNSNKTNKFRVLETDLRIILPLNSFSRLLVSSADVIHSWTIQRIGIKTDAVPGRLNQLNLIVSHPGVFYGQCSEICGSNHSFMPICLKILSLSNFINYIKNLSLNSLKKALVS